MLKNFLREVVAITAGKQAEEIADLLNNKKYVNEFILAKKMDITINQTRNILYKISDHGLVSSTRKKDKRKGWYTYFWKIEVLKSLEFLRDLLVKNINQLSYHIKSRETKLFYVCERCNVEFNEENAMLHEFICNECGGVFTMKNNTKLLKDLERNLDKFKGKLSFVDVEIEKEKVQINKKRAKELKKEEAEKALKKIEAAKKRAANKKIAEKNKPASKKIVKKSVKKKVVKKTVVKKVESKNKIKKTVAPQAYPEKSSKKISTKGKKILKKKVPSEKIKFVKGSKK